MPDDVLASVGGKCQGNETAKKSPQETFPFQYVQDYYLKSVGSKFQRN
jgi:hypothetical protein